MSINPFAAHGLSNLSVPPPILMKLPSFGLLLLFARPGSNVVSISSVAPSRTSNVVALPSPCARWLRRATMREGLPFNDGNAVIGPLSPQHFQREPLEMENASVEYCP